MYEGKKERKKEKETGRQEDICDDYDDDDNEEEGNGMGRNRLLIGLTSWLDSASRYVKMGMLK